ncbi:iron complex outermembrane recepter protein [Pustulibacterium marinum]|uniref:Iron complex outermembrane recepter protein n=1 Tax=Pustulibacterium marinum TaxID=1224947 RepID=A0A1I7IDY9_9FLAO|nr:TonB-dependent receptor [Pustulibacterium marinum]SFU71169.1 iron complex outermembrane recepter protein [Pustulibacterium marinum]
MKQFYLFISFISCLACKLQAQDTIPLAEVEVSDTQLKRFSDTQQTIELSDSISIKNQASLTSLLNFNSFIYFKQNGLGMVSSPSFRGTTAQQTAVLWNGININSQFNGQTDFNTINIRNFDAVEVRSGGGSVLFGSGAIGGSIHLNDYIKFSEGFKNTAFVKYGSFNTIDGSYKSSYSSEKLSLNIALSRVNSDNNYEYVGKDRNNSNGQFYNQSVSANVGYKLNENNLVKFFTYIYDGDRNFSLIVPTETRTSYSDFNTRNMLEWDGFYGKFISKLKVAYTTEHYKYYANIYNDSYTEGKANSVIGKYDLAYHISDGILLNFVSDINHTNGEGSSIAQNKRTITAFNVMWKHILSNKFLYEVTSRKEFTQNYESPFLFSLGAKYKLLNDYEITLNGSKNFRIPTYNDLFWAGSGNPDLNPETSYQLEFGNHFKLNKVDLSITGYYNDITDMIRWVPQGSVWKPVNTQHVATYGIESKLKYQKKFGKHTMTINGTYTYTKAKDLDSEKELIYVPNHKATGMLQYKYKRLQAYYQYMFVGNVYTDSDNNPLYSLDAYGISNTGLSYHFGRQKGYQIGTEINNLWNVNYQSVRNRFMPGINYAIYMKLKF